MDIFEPFYGTHHAPPISQKLHTVSYSVLEWEFGCTCYQHIAHLLLHFLSQFLSPIDISTPNFDQLVLTNVV